MAPKVFRENGLVLRNRIKVLSLPFYNSGQEPYNESETLEENSFVDCDLGRWFRH